MSRVVKDNNNNSDNKIIVGKELMKIFSTPSKEYLTDE